jgi:hypothetical protein
MKTIIRCILGSLFFASPASIADPDSVPTMQEVCEFRITLKELASLSKPEPEGHILGDPSSCVLSELEVVDSDNHRVLLVKDRYLSAHEFANTSAPYQVIQSASGGNRCCTDIYFIDREGNSIKLANGSPFIKIAQDDHFYLVESSNGKKIRLPR